MLRDVDSIAMTGLWRGYHVPLLAMSEEQLAALLAKLKDDAGLQEKLKGVADLDAAMTLAQEAGFDVSKEDWLKHQAQTNLELSDKELEGVAGGVNANPFYTMVPNECNPPVDPPKTTGGVGCLLS